MIHDLLINREQYKFSHSVLQAMDYCNGLTSDAPDGVVEISGRDVYVVIMSYETKEPADAFLETHRDYTDIQIVLAGSEKVECYDRDALTISQPYAEDSDAELYVRPKDVEPVSIALNPGSFALFEAPDAHMPSLRIDAPQLVKKVVIKVRNSILFEA